MNAIYFVVDEKLSDLASVAALQMSQHWACDFHIFVERRDRSATVQEVNSERITYHYERLSGFLTEDLPEFERWPRIVYLRLFAPQVLQGYQRLLYLDADILAFSADPALWQVPLPKGLGAVADLAVLEDGPNGLERSAWLAGIGVTSGRYLNSGVLLIDPEVWNRIDFAGLLPKYFAAYPDASFPDQDFLAHVFDGSWVELSPRFNWQGGVLHWGLTRAVDPVFVHFCMIVRPWHGPQAAWLSANDPAYIAIYDRLFSHAGMSVTPYRKTFRLRQLRQIKYRLFAWLAGKGFTLPRERSKRREWQRNRLSLLAYVNQGLAEGRLGADPRHKITVPEVRSVWDGRFVGSRGDMPPGAALKSAADAANAQD